MSLILNFTANNSLPETIALTWDHPIDDSYNQLIDIDITSVVSNTVNISEPVNVEVGYLIYQGSSIYIVNARGVQTTAISVISASGMTDGAALLKVVTNTIIQRKKDAFPVELATGTVFTQNVAVEIFNGSEIIGNGTAISSNGSNILTDTNANFTQDLVGRILRDSSSYNFTILSIISSTELQVQANDTLHSGPFIILADFSQSNPVQIQPINYTQISSSAGIITDPNGFLLDPTTNTYAQNHQLMNRIVIDGDSIPYIILDNTTTELIINNTTVTPNISVYPGYTVLQPFNGINSALVYNDTFIDSTEAAERVGTGLEQYTWYYYTGFTKNLFIGPAGEDFATYDNVNSTQAYALSTGDSNFGELLYNYFPELYRQTDDPTDAVGTPAPSGTGNLQDLMSVFGSQFDESYALVNTFRLQDVYTISQSVLQQFSYQLNLPAPDTTIGVDTLRRIGLNLINTYKNKGNKISIAEFIRIITTWDISGGLYWDVDGNNGNYDSAIDQAIIDTVPNVTAFRFYSASLGSLNSRFYGTLQIVSIFTPLSYNAVNGILAIPTSVNIDAVLVNDYIDINGVLYVIVGGIQSNPVPNGTVLFSNPSAVSYTYNSVTGVVQYSSAVSLSSGYVNDIFMDGVGNPFVISAVNVGGNNLTIPAGQTVNLTPAVDGGGSIQQGQKEVQLNTGLSLSLVPMTIIRTTPEVNIVPSFTPTSYNSLTGQVAVPDSVNLTNVRIGDVFIDASGNDFTILANINNTDGSKGFQIATGQIVSVASGAVIDRIATQGSGIFLRQLPGIIIPGFFSFREYVVLVPEIAMFIETISSISIVDNQTTITFNGADFGRTNGLVDCIYYPNESFPSEFFTIMANTSNTVTLDGIPQFINIGDVSIFLTPLNSARFQRILGMISIVSPVNTKPGFEFTSPIDIPI